MTDDSKAEAREIGREIQDATGIYPISQVGKIATLVAERDTLRQSAAEHKNAAAKALAENDILAAERDRLRQALGEAQKAIRAVHEWIGALPLTPTFDMKWEAQKSLEAAGSNINKALHDV